MSLRVAYGHRRGEPQGEAGAGAGLGELGEEGREVLGARSEGLPLAPCPAFPLCPFADLGDLSRLGGACAEPRLGAGRRRTGTSGPGLLAVVHFSCICISVRNIL